MCCVTVKWNYRISSINAAAFIKFFVIRVRRLFEDAVYLKSNLFHAGCFLNLFKVNYHKLFSCFDCTPLTANILMLDIVTIEENVFRLDNT